jgi:TolA protein
VKFVCERCGKKYATAEDPAPGRVYKLKCKACGNLISVRASSGGAATSSGTKPARRETMSVPAIPPPRPSDPPEVPLEIAAPEPAAAVPDLLAGLPGLPLGDSTTEISMSSISPSQEETPPSGTPGTGAGYVDLFADLATAGTSVEAKKEDPFLAAARASLPDTFGSGGSPAPDIFGSMRNDRLPPLDPDPSGHHRAPPTPKIPVIPKPPQQKSGAPIALIAGGLVVLVGILAFTLFGTNKKAQPGAQAAAQSQAQSRPLPPAQVQAPAPVPAPPPAQPARQPPVAVAAAPDARKAEEDQRAREEQRRRADEARERERQERAAREERDRVAREAKERERQERAARDREGKDARDRDRAERAAREREAKEAKQRERQEREREAREAKAERDRQAREAKAERERQAREAKSERDRQIREAAERARQEREAEKVASANTAEPEGGLTPAQMEKVLSSTKKAFDGCIQAAKGTDVKLDGRRVMLRLNIQTTGAVTYPTLDDVTLNGTELGQCLKNAARLMVFPKFKGDTMHVEVPLVLASR